MDKVIQSSKNSTPYGGLNFICHAMNRVGFDKFLNDHLGSRSIYAHYSNADSVRIVRRFNPGKLLKSTVKPKKQQASNINLLCAKKNIAS